MQPQQARWKRRKTQQDGAEKPQGLGVEGSLEGAI